MKSHRFLPCLWAFLAAVHATVPVNAVETSAAKVPGEARVYKSADGATMPYRIFTPTYFNHMHTYHISYAAFGNDGADETGYIRGRRYLPEGKGLRGTELVPEFRPEGLFETGVTHRITVIKRDRDLFLRISNPQRTFYGHMRNPRLPPVTEGRIGLRQMFTRSSRYGDFRISMPLQSPS